MKVDLKKFDIKSLDDLREAFEVILTELSNGMNEESKDTIEENENNLNWHIKEFLDSIDFDEEEYSCFLDFAEPLLPTVGVNILLRHMAYYFNAKRKESIDSLDTIYLIDLVTNTVVEKENIKKYLTRVLITYATFKNKEDAEKALKIVQPLLEDIYGKL
jgi:hypothetical protein